VTTAEHAKIAENSLCRSGGTTAKYAETAEMFLVW
jgi:hypothetical protein